MQPRQKTSLRKLNNMRRKYQYERLKVKVCQEQHTGSSRIGQCVCIMCVCVGSEINNCQAPNAFPCQRMRKLDTMANNPAIQVLPTSAYTAE